MRILLETGLCKSTYIDLGHSHQVPPLLCGHKFKPHSSHCAKLDLLCIANGSLGISKGDDCKSHLSKIYPAFGQGRLKDLYAILAEISMLEKYE